jgi:hypothetical protein
VSTFAGGFVATGLSTRSERRRLDNKSCNIAGRAVRPANHGDGILLHPGVCVDADPIIGWLSFWGDVAQDVFADVEGQYVVLGDGRKLRGVWLVADQEDMADVPAMVYAPSPTNREC